MRQLIGVTVILACSMTLVNDATADCVCRCINGEVRALCSSAIDLQPICSPQVCPITPPSIAPIQQPYVPPVGTTNCRQAQVQNPRTGQYEWREVCR